MRALIDFIYLGQTSVSQDEVQAFLTLGEELGVKGLVRNNRMENIAKVKHEDQNLVETFKMNELKEWNGTQWKRIKKDHKSDISHDELKMEDTLNYEDINLSAGSCKNALLDANITIQCQMRPQVQENHHMNSINCEKTFKRKDVLTRHFKSTHAEETLTSS